MTSNFITRLYALGTITLLFLSVSRAVMAQDIPEIPAEVSFGGITVKFDRSAQGIIEEDIKSLMSNKKFWEEKMDRAILHFPIVEGILMDEEVPIDFKYLAVQESSFKPDGVSTSNAVGYWQLKAETARELNLRVDNEVDERKNLSSSTHAAAWYLKKNNQQFNNWVSTLYSYYKGAGDVKKLVPANWAYAREVTLTGKTDRYVLRFFAHKIALEAGLDRYRSTNALVLFESPYGKGQTFDQVAQALKVNVQDLQAYNKWFKGDVFPSDREYYITVPSASNEVAEVRNKLTTPATPAAIEKGYDASGFPLLKKTAGKTSAGRQLYEINGLPGIEAIVGDQPKAIASAGNLSGSRFMRFNDMIKDTPLIPGKIYYLAKKNKKAAVPFHTARPGDTWQSVSQDYGIRLVNLLRYNRTISRNYPIQTGQVLWLTEKRPRNEPVKIVPPKTTTPTTQPAEPAIVSKGQAAEQVAVTSTPAAANDVPKNASGRKKYSPVLVDKNAPASSTATVVSTPENEPISTAPVKSAPKSMNDDKVVVISQDSQNSEMNETANPSLYSKSNSKSAKNKAATAAPKETSGTIHTVASGETYFSIARKYDIPVRDLLAMNDLSTSSTLKVGQELKVGDGAAQPVKEEKVSQPVKTPTPVVVAETPKPKETTREASRPVAEYHVVESGQTYYSISKQFGLSVNELLALNGFKGTERLSVGQKIRVASNGANGEVISKISSAGSNGDALIHTVVSGETLFRVAQTYGTSVDALKKLNNLSGNNVVVGQRLKIPQQ